MTSHFKQKNNTVKYFLTILAVILLKFANAQTGRDQSNDYEKNPVWINMMEDPDANYYEAVKAFEVYWKKHPKPSGEEEEMEKLFLLSSDRLTKEQQKEKAELEREMQREIKKSAKKKYSNKELLEISQREDMKYQVKRFENWKLEVLPFVKENGHIMTANEQQAIWQKQQDELNNNR